MQLSGGFREPGGKLPFSCRGRGVASFLKQSGIYKIPSQLEGHNQFEGHSATHQWLSSFGRVPLEVDFETRLILGGP